MLARRERVGFPKANRFMPCKLTFLCELLFSSRHNACGAPEPAEAFHYLFRSAGNRSRGGACGGGGAGRMVSSEYAGDEVSRFEREVTVQEFRVLPDHGSHTGTLQKGRRKVCENLTLTTHTCSTEQRKAVVMIILELRRRKNKIHLSEIICRSVSVILFLLSSDTSVFFFLRS